MASGRVNQALRLLYESHSVGAASGLLHLDETITLADGSAASVQDLLRGKHPQAQPAPVDILMDGVPAEVNAIRFESLTPKLVLRIALQCKGSAGPSGLNSDAWRRLCSSFQGASSNMCADLTNFARLLATQELNPSTLSPFLACRLIALDKRPGVRPIGVCDVARRIVAKAILQVVDRDIEEACGYLQKCSGLPAGLEAAVHAMQEIHDDESTEGVLFVDAKNAFNSLNRAAALHNVRHICPALGMVLQNCYCAPSRLFVSGGGELSSEEGTTQGDPLSMPFYALATRPLLQRLLAEHREVRQAWLADDSAGAGRLQELRAWWNTLCVEGVKYGYYPNSVKTRLLVKPGHLGDAHQIFDGTGLEIVTDGARYLGSAIGQPEFRKSFLQDKVVEWQHEIEQLAAFASTEPHAAFAALTHGLWGRYTFILRTLPVDEGVLLPIDESLTDVFLPVLLGRGKLSENAMALLKLPARLGGIGLPCLSTMAENELAASRAMTKGQIEELLHQNVNHVLPSVETLHRAAVKARNATKDRRRKRELCARKTLMECPDLDARHIETLTAKGASSWLTVLPLREHGFWLSKRDYRNAMALRYGWQLDAVPLTCVCGADFTPDHAMICSFGGFLSIRHNELRDILGGLLSEVCHNVAIEPRLQPLNGEVFRSKTTTTASDARADVRATGFWTNREDAFFDVRVFHANAPAYRSLSPTKAFELHERRKQLEYEERIVNVDHGSFCPLVFSTSGAVGPLCSIFLKRLAGMVADEMHISYSSAMAWLRCRLSFALLRSAVMCIRGSRSSHRKPIRENGFDVSVSLAESRCTEG